MRECPICYKQFEERRKHKNRPPKIYCSVQCANTDRKKIGSRKPGQHKKVLADGKHFNCVYCKKDFVSKHKKAKYCSKECSHKARIISLEKHCKICGRILRRKHGEETTRPENGQLYCSKKCRGLAERRPRPPCLICGGPTPHWDSRTCSMNCQAEFKRRFHLLRIKKALGEGVQLNPFYNLDACKWFKEYDNQNNTVGKYATNGGEEFVKGYWLDYINHDKKLIIEWNEKQHYNKDGSLRKRDVRKRDDVLKTFPDYEFWSIKEDTMQIDKA